MRNSIRTRLTIAFIGVSIVPLLLVGITLAFQSLNVQREQAQRFQSEVTRRVSSDINAFINRLELQLKQAAKELRSLPESTNADNLAGLQRGILSKLPSYPSVFQDLTVVNALGVVTSRLTRLELDIAAVSTTQQFTQLPEFQEPISSRTTYFGPVRFDEVTGEPSMIIAEPLIDPLTDAVSGVLISNIRFKEIWDLIASVPVAPGETVYIVDRQGKLVAHLNPSLVLSNRSVNLPARLTQGGLNSADAATGLDGRTVVMAVNTLEFGGQVFNVVAERDIVAALALAIQTAIITVVLLILALIVAAALSFLVAREIVRPIRQLARVASILSERSEDFKATQLENVTGRKDELGALARVFQTMGKQVQTREHDLKQQVMELKIEIDEVKKRKAVEELTGSDFFRELQGRAGEMRRRAQATKAGNPGDLSSADTSS